MKGKAACSKSFPSTRSIFRQPNLFHETRGAQKAWQRALMMRGVTINLAKRFLSASQT